MRIITVEIRVLSVAKNTLPQVCHQLNICQNVSNIKCHVALHSKQTRYPSQALLE